VVEEEGEKELVYVGGQRVEVRIGCDFGTEKREERRWWERKWVEHAVGLRDRLRPSANRRGRMQDE